MREREKAKEHDSDDSSSPEVSSEDDEEYQDPFEKSNSLQKKQGRKNKY